MRVFVTGASGHVGGAIAGHLVALGHDVVGLSRRAIAPDGVHAVSVDLGRGDPLSVLPGPRPDAIVHASACLSKDPLDPEVVAVNAVGTSRVIALAVKEHVPLVYISSLNVIGRPVVLPVTEDHPTHPPTSYHATKLFGEHLAAVALSGIAPAASLRVTSPIGAGMPDGRILSHFVRRAMLGAPLVLAGEGSRKQDYVDVTDIAIAVQRAIAAGADGVYNIGAGTSIANLSLARRCIDVLGSSSTVELSGRPDAEEGLMWEVAIERAAVAFGYRPTISLDSSIMAVAASRETLA